MTETLIQSLAWSLLAALLAVELFLALTSWIETGDRPRSRHRTPLLITRASTIRDHFRSRRVQGDSLRRQFPDLRGPGHRRRVRDAAVRLQPTRLTATLGWCLDCRGSRLRGLSHCPGCDRRLVEPATALSA